MRDVVTRVSRERFLLVIVLAVAAALRLCAIGQLPPGLYHDEAQNGLDALQVIDGARPVFFEENNGREPLFIYLTALSISLLGRSALAIRLVAALLGALTIPVTYAMVRELLGRREALLTAAIAAITLWHVNLSRIGFRAVSLPLFSALCLWFYARALRRDHWLDFALSGLFLGVSLYCYLPARFTPVCFALLLAYWRWRRRSIHWRHQLLFLAVALLTALPLLLYATQHLDGFLARSAQVSIFNPATNHGDWPGALLQSAARTLAMFNWRGDFVPRHNVPLRPVFDLLLGAFSLIGLVLCARRAGSRQEYTLLLLHFAVMLMPTILSENAPHFLRAVGVLPVAWVFPAVGLGALQDRLQEHLPRPATELALALILTVGLSATVLDYFARHVHSEAVYYNFESGVVDLAADVNHYLDMGWPQASGRSTDREPAQGQRSVYLESLLWRNWSGLRYLLSPSDSLRILGEDRSQTLQADEARLIVWPYADSFRYLSLLPHGRLISVREGPQERGDLEEESRLLCVIYEVADSSGVTSNVGAQFEEDIELLGYETHPERGRTRVRLYWRAGTAPDKDYTVFLHWLRGGAAIAQSDSYPAQGYFPTHVWRPGDTVADDHWLSSTENPQAGDTLVVGMYLLQTMERLQVLSPLGQSIADSVTLPHP